VPKLKSLVRGKQAKNRPPMGRFLANQNPYQSSLIRPQRGGQTVKVLLWRLNLSSQRKYGFLLDKTRKHSLLLRLNLQSTCGLTTSLRKKAARRQVSASGTERRVRSVRRKTAHGDSLLERILPHLLKVRPQESATQVPAGGRPAHADRKGRFVSRMREENQSATVGSPADPQSPRPTPGRRHQNDLLAGDNDKPKGGDVNEIRRAAEDENRFNNARATALEQWRALAQAALPISRYAPGLMRPRLR